MRLVIAGDPGFNNLSPHCGTSVRGRCWTLPAKEKLMQNFGAKLAALINPTASRARSSR